MDGYIKIENVVIPAEKLNKLHTLNGVVPGVRGFLYDGKDLNINADFVKGSDLKVILDAIDGLV